MKNCVALCILVSIASALPANNLRTEWQKFKNTYGKQYLTTAEEDIRFHTFSRNLQTINEHNKQYESGLTTYKMAVNEFTDWTDSEFEKMLGFVPHIETELLSTDVDYQQEWENYKQMYHKTYSEQEDKFRIKLFTENFDKIQQHNENYKKGLTTFEMGLSRFSDMTLEEVKKFMGFHDNDQLVMALDNIYNDCKPTWQEYKEKYAKVFQTNEDNMRFEIFCNNLHTVQKHNEDYKKGLTTYKMEINKFSDRTPEEMKKMMGYMGKSVEAPALEKVDDVCYKEYAEFKKTYNRYFETQIDETRHLNIFCKNVEIIKQHNKDFQSGLTTYAMSVNKFTDMTPEEMQHYFGLINERVEDLYESEWQKFRAMFKKTYMSIEEEQHRYEVFCSNLDEILKHNEEFEQGLTTFKMSINKFSDLTHEEFQDLLRRGL